MFSKKETSATIFDEILGSPVRKPVHIRDLLNKYQLSPNGCVFVGDALTDYNAAVETGLHFIGIRTEVDFPDGTFSLPDCSSLKEAVANFCIW
jgi:phosphoglycolate phosphatase-like HAD superfamily hydrolase